MSTDTSPPGRAAMPRANPPRPNPPPRGGGPQGLGDVLERVLDKGLVVAGDIQISLLDIELITIKVRLLVASADTAQQMGIDWWQTDPFLNSEAGRQEAETLAEENRRLQARLARLEAVVVDQLGLEGEPEDEPEDEPEREDLYSASRPPVRRGGERRPGHPEVLERRPDDP